MPATEPAEAEDLITRRAAAPDPGGTGDRPGWITRWVRADPVRAVATVLIVVQALVRAQLAARGFLAEDDFVLANRAAGEPLSVEFLASLFNNHLMPAGLLTFWVIAKVAGLVYWPYLLLLTAGQTVLGIAFYRLLRLMLRSGWGLLIPLCLLLFSPLTLDTTSMWAIGVYLLPMHLAMVWALGAQVKFVRTGRLRHLATLALSVVCGLLFFEKSLLIVPLVFLATACLFVTGGPLRSLGRAVRRYWPSWLVLALLTTGYLVLYLNTPVPPCNPLSCTSALRPPAASAGEVVTFVEQLVGSTLIPGLLGGPWEWTYTGDGPPLTAAPEVLRWLALAALIALIVATIWLRRRAARAWVLLLLYLATVTSVFAATRLGTPPLSTLAGYVPRYVSDVVVVAALCIGVALLGLRDDVEAVPARLRLAVLRTPGPVTAAVIVVVALGVGTAWSAARFGDGWAVKQGRDYLRTAQAELAAAPPGTVFFDQGVPTAVVAGYFYPYNLQSQFFRTVHPQPTFVTEAENLSAFDDTGHIRPAWVQGRETLHPPAQDCGYELTGGQPTLMPLGGPVFDWGWVVRVGYLSSANTTATLRLGTASHTFAVHRGLHQIFFQLEAGGDTIELTVADPDVSLCLDKVIVGTVAALP